MAFFFIKWRQYQTAIVDRAMHKVFSIDRITALTPIIRDRIPLTITFHPVKNSINSNFNLLNSDSNSSNISSHWPLFSFKKDRNLCTFLVKGTLPSNKEPGTFIHSRKRNQTCPFVVSRTTITGP